MTASRPTEPADSPLAKLNPAWVGTIIGVVTGIGLWGALYYQVGRHDVELREIHVWRTAKDVAETELKKDIQYIKEDNRQTKESQLRMEATISRLSTGQPQIVYLPMPQGQQVSPPARAGVGVP